MKKINDLTKYLSKRGFSKEASYLNSLAYKKYANNDKSLLSQIMRGTSFSSEIIPQKISSIPSDLQQFCASKGRSDVSFKSNGVLRDLAVTLKGGAARDPGSYHALGLAHDLIILTPKNNNKYSGIGENTSIIKKDPELVKLMKEYAESRDLTWGGNFSRGNAFTLPTGETVHDTELHHFEIPREKMLQYMHPIIGDVLSRNGINLSELTSSSVRQKAYKIILSIISSNESPRPIKNNGVESGNNAKKIIEENLSDADEIYNDEVGSYERNQTEYDDPYEDSYKHESILGDLNLENLSKTDKHILGLLGKAFNIT